MASASLQVVAGTIADTLRIEPVVVDNYIRGLRAAERITGTRVGPFECADILCCLLSTDPTNATAPYHLPLSGIVTGVSLIDAQAPEFDAFNMCFGEMLAALISGDQLAARASGISVRGAAGRLGASMVLDVAGNDLTSLRLFYGYHLVPDHLACGPVPALETSRLLSGTIVDDLRAMLMPPGQRAHRLALRQEMIANTPPDIRSTIH
jgi:hypothetical protein